MGKINWRMKCLALWRGGFGCLPLLCECEAIVGGQYFT